MDSIDPKLKTWGIAVAVVVSLIALVDFVALRGETVAGANVSLRADSEPATLAIARPFEKHLVKITTRRSRKGETKGQSIAYRLVGPDGSTVAEDSELISRKHRFFTFTPAKPGDYALYAEETNLIGTGRGTAHVSVAVNDRRTLSRWMGF